jgi:hypothetical protein
MSSHRCRNPKDRSCYAGCIDLGLDDCSLDLGDEEPGELDFRSICAMSAVESVSTSGPF